MKRFARIRREDGQALVEFALVLPVLLMVATGITSFGLVFYKYITLTDAVRTGARTLSLGRGNTAPAPNDPCNQAVKQTVNSATDAGLTSNNVHLIINGVQTTPPCSGTGTNWTQGNQVTVTASVTYSISIFGVISVKNGTMTAHATDAIE